MIIGKISLVAALVGMSTFVQGDYVIQLGVYKNDTLPHRVAKRLDSTLQSDIKVVKRGDVYWAYTKPFPSKASNKKRLKAYQKVFSDAYFREYTVMKDESKTVPNEEEGFDPLAFVKTIVPPKEEEKAKEAEKSTEEAKLEEEGFDPMAFVKTIVPPKEEEKPKEEEIDPLEFVRSLNAN